MAALMASGRCSSNSVKWSRMALLLLRNSAITPSVRLGLPIRASLRERTSSSSLSTLFSTRARAARVTGVPFSSATLDLVVPAGPVLQRSRRRRLANPLRPLGHHFIGESIEDVGRGPAGDGREATDRITTLVHYLLPFRFAPAR